MAIIGYANVGNTIKPIEVGRNDGGKIVGFFDGVTEIGMNDRGVMKKFLPLPKDPNRWCKVEVLENDRYEMMWGSEKRFVNKGTEFEEKDAHPVSLSTPWMTDFIIRFRFPKDTFKKYASVIQTVSLRGQNGSGETEFVKVKFDRQTDKTSAKVKLEVVGNNGSINNQMDTNAVFNVEEDYVLYICEKVNSSSQVETHVALYEEKNGTKKAWGKVTSNNLSLGGTFSGKCKMVPFNNSDHFKVRSTLVMFDEYKNNNRSRPFTDQQIKDNYIEWYKDPLQVTPPI